MIMNVALLNYSNKPKWTFHSDDVRLPGFGGEFPFHTRVGGVLRHRTPGDSGGGCSEHQAAHRGSTTYTLPYIPTRDSVFHNAVVFPPCTPHQGIVENHVLEDIYIVKQLVVELHEGKRDEA